MVRERENTMQASSLHFLWIIREQYILIVSVSVQLLLCKLIRYSLKNNFVLIVRIHFFLKNEYRRYTISMSVYMKHFVIYKLDVLSAFLFDLHSSRPWNYTAILEKLFCVFNKSLFFWFNMVPYAIFIFWHNIFLPRYVTFLIIN